MTSPRRYQRGASTGAVLLAAAAIAGARHGLYPYAAVLALGAATLTEAAVRERRRLKRARAECDWARRRAFGENPAPLDPCCLLARASHGQAHDHKCTDTTTWPTAPKET